MFLNFVKGLIFSILTLMYTVYRTINVTNQKSYTGVHKTDNPNDSYLGSGVAINQAVKKYGRENFKKEILFIFDNEDDAFAKETELTQDYKSRNNYNMKLGGVGGFTKEDAWKGFIAKSTKGGFANKTKGNCFGGVNGSDPSECGKKGGKGNKGKPKSEGHKQALRESWKRKKLKSVVGPAGLEPTT